MNVYKITLIISVAVMLVTSCMTTSPPIKKIDLPNENKWVSPKGQPFKINKDWWKAFGDEKLNALIDKAIIQNLDLQIALERTKLAEKAIGEANLKQVPKVGAEAGKQITTRDGRDAQEKFTASVKMSWEVDIWGKFQKMSSANLSEYKASEADWKASYLQLIKDITLNYISLRQYDENRALLKESLDYSEQLRSIFQKLFEKGLEDKANLSLQKAESLRLESQIVEVDRARGVLVNQIAILLAEPADELRIPVKKLSDSLKPLSFPKDINSNLLERRPDIIAAELRVQKDFFMSESTRAARLPSVTLGLSGDLANESLSLLTQGWTAAIIPKISFPALDPQTKVNVEKQDINLEITKKQYKNTVIKAIAEVENALINRQARLKRMKLERDRFKELNDADIKNALNHKAGVISTLERIQFQQQLIGSRQEILNFYSQELQDTVAIFTALGGGWEF
jgi:NodT family efflux transporter outer membrane factor (OMF) lipoprotein